jgi:hypothetical protein
VELLEDVADVAFDTVLTEREQQRDLPIGLALSDQRQDFPLPFGQLRQRITRNLNTRPLHPAKNRLGDRWIQQRAATSDGLDTLD